MNRTGMPVVRSLVNHLKSDGYLDLETALNMRELSAKRHGHDFNATQDQVLEGLTYITYKMQSRPTI